MNYRRIELAICLKTAPDQDPEAFNHTVDSVARQISGLAALPWNHFTWLGPGHTCGLSDAAPDCSTALLVYDRQLPTAQQSRIVLPPFRGDPVNLLWLIPITDAEQKRLESDPTSIDEILATR